MGDYYDNPELRITGISRDRLAEALRLALSGRIHSYIIDSKAGLILRYEAEGGTPITDYVDISNFVWSWLRSSQKSVANYENERGDAANAPGWIVYVGEWGHIVNDIGSACAIKPFWCWIGK
jgi:hypothetical protein